MVRHNFTKEIITELFKKEPLDVWINSFGGCRSNYIRDCIKDSYTTYNTAYELAACHYVTPLDTSVGSGIFCYTEDVGIAISSQIKRGMYHNFQKLMGGNEETPFDIGVWLENIDKQIDNWTTPSHFPIVIINTDVVGDYKQKFEEIYEVDMLPFKKRSTSQYIDEVKPYTELIEKINSKLRNLPNFSVNEKFNKIFVCGISRTGTKSLGDYLQLFDLKVVHNGGRVFNPMQLDHIDVLVDDKQTQFLYEVLNQTHPNSLFIYTNRNTKSWVDKIISWKPNSSYIYHQSFGIDGGIKPDTKEMLTSFKEEHFSRFQLFSNKLPNDRVLYLELEDSNKAKKVCEFLGFEHSDDLEYPNIKYR